ncbi:hypothetical protein GGX14DRAFT_351911 [Mycena pura]|uniref:CxC6 like cysteine cluster associated with KDZ domain-containing protein n=1 Tax=Mycena pura TaxID=153505 RepID=A0AAD6YMC1_9AGAR|nr:hypothetical protein GGX14DRAFT_351911 [Mycena pura]
MLYPPYRRCIRSECAGTKLGNPQQAFCRLYTLRRGILPAYEVSLYCAKCNTRYHYAYSVQKPASQNAVREYYEDCLPYIQAQESSFLENKLCEYFEYYMCLSHTSTANLARMYNSNLGQTDVMMSPHSALLPEIAQNTIMDGFFMHALLRRFSWLHTPLTLPHNISHDHRFDSAMDQCNQAMAGTGQPQYFHACHDCMKFFRREDGSLYYVRGGTTDGVTLGHPCCSQTNCQNRLASAKDRFCPAHKNLASQCHIIGCEQPASADFITCSISEHRAKEQTILSLISTEDFDDTVRDNTGIWEVNSAVMSGKKGQAKKQPTVRLRTTRRWTHNEQLFVLSCGVIIARATFFSHEGPASVKDFLKKIFPYPWLLPTHIFFDKACLLLKHLRAQGDSFFNHVRLVVDVFHARNHHKEDDTFCNTNNNPALFPELRTNQSGKEKWTLNSSNAEQANVWFGAFQAMTREMSVSRFNFFLDEMIFIRNEWIVKESAKKGKQPFLQSFEVMKDEWMQMYSPQ